MSTELVLAVTLATTAHSRVSSASATVLSRQNLKPLQIFADSFADKDRDPVFADRR